MNNVLNFMLENSEHPMQEKVDLAIKMGNKARFNLSTGLTLVIKKNGKAEFIFRAQKKNDRSQAKLGNYKRECSSDDIRNGMLDIKKAINTAEKLQSIASAGLHPVKELKSIKYSISTTVDDVFKRVLANTKPNVNCTEAMERNYKNEIAPYLGKFPISQLEQTDVQVVINKVLESGRKTVAEKVLYLIKRLFNHAEENNICFNLTRKMTPQKHAGGKAVKVGIALADHDLTRSFLMMRSNEATFTSSLYYLTILLVALGLRKKELITAKWTDYDRRERLLHIEREVAKNMIAIAIPISRHLEPVFEQLLKMGAGSDLLFPALKQSKCEHMSLSTLNAGLKRIFKKERENYPQERVQEFTVHDLRRTFRTILSRMGIPKEIAELCINHRKVDSNELSEVERYDRYAKLKERRKACDQAAEKIMELSGESEYLTPQLRLVS